MKKQIRILTYCTCTSIGSILQSYALTKALRDCGYESSVWLEAPTQSSQNKKCFSLKNLVKYVCRIPCKGKIQKAHQKRQSFISGEMKVEYLPDVKAFEEKAREHKDDVYLAGSDQIWNPDNCNPLFFLNFVSDSTRISYAASMGQTKISPEKENIIRHMLRAFDRISVREKACIDALQKLTDQEMCVHLDPTFLVEADRWKEIEKPYKVSGPYILLYMLYWDQACKDQIIALKKRTGLPVYAICSDVSRAYADHHLYDVGVEEFLWLIDHAEYVVTSSFHGVAFSIIFRKKFAAVINSKMPSRIENVLDVLSAPLVSIDELDSTDKFQYDIVSERIENERKRSIEYLKEAIG